MLRVRTTLSGWEGGPGLATFYFLTPLQNVDAAARCVSYVHSLFTGALAGMYPTSVLASVQGDVDVLEPGTGAITDTLTAPAPATAAGQGGAGKAPPAVAGLLRLSTSTFIAGRRVRGRVFVSPLAAAVVTSDGLMSNGAADGKATLLAAMDALMDPGDIWVVWHRPKLKLGGQACPITATSMPYKLAVLTSRRD